jgi:SAM-dependent methyltransferase
MSMPTEKKLSLPFDYEGIPLGYYDEMMKSGHPIRRCWHRQKFSRVIAALPKGEGQSILDIGCFAGTFLSLLPREQFPRQLGVDILPKQIAWASERYGPTSASSARSPRWRDSRPSTRNSTVSR